YNIKYGIQDNNVTYLRVLDPLAKFHAGRREGPGFARAVAVEPLFGCREKASVDFPAELTGRSSRPVPGQQYDRQQRIVQHHPPVMMDHQDPSRERVGI